MTVRRWELGKTSPKTEEIKKLAEALNTSVEYLMGLNDSEEKTPQEQNIPININNAPEVSNDDLDLSYWGGVAERASRAARSGNKAKIALITPLVKAAFEVLSGAETSEESQEKISQPRFIGIQGNNNEIKNNNLNVRTG